MIGFRAALDLDTDPLSNWCAERAKPGRGKPVDEPPLLYSAYSLTSRLLATSTRLSSSAATRLEFDARDSINVSAATMIDNYARLASR